MISKLLKNEKMVKVVVLVGVALILFIFATSVFGNREENEEQESYPSFDDYSQTLEARLEEIIGLIEGTGETDILVSIEKSVEDVYTERGNSIATTISPVARGVVVVCEGAKNPVIKEKIVEAVSKALGISANKICVTY